MYSGDRREVREVFFRAWRNYRQNRPLAGVEQLIVDVALQHPEYQPLLELPDLQSDRDYHPLLGESNPFVHMGMHIAIAEQLAIDQPPGVREHYRRLQARLPGTHAVEHAMMDCLSEVMRRAAQNQQAPDQNTYADCLRQLAQKT